jgi:hypothetical protein
MVAKGRKTVKLPVLPEHDCDLIGCGFQVGVADQRDTLRIPTKSPGHSDMMSPGVPR